MTWSQEKVNLFFEMHKAFAPDALLDESYFDFERVVTDFLTTESPAEIIIDAGNQNINSNFEVVAEFVENRCVDLDIVPEGRLFANGLRYSNANASNFQHERKGAMMMFDSLFEVLVQNGKSLPPPMNAAFEKWMAVFAANVDMIEQDIPKTGHWIWWVFPTSRAGYADPEKVVCPKSEMEEILRTPVTDPALMVSLQRWAAIAQNIVMKPTLVPIEDHGRITYFVREWREAMKQIPECAENFRVVDSFGTVLYDTAAWRPQHQHHASGGGAAGTTWTCEKCTFDNRMSDVRCRLCMARRPF
jgi:hypothetical protein